MHEHKQKLLGAFLALIIFCVWFVFLPFRTKACCMIICKIMFMMLFSSQLQGHVESQLKGHSEALANMRNFA
jgi:hypothetical protein